MVAQGYTQEEGIDYNEVFALVAKIEAIRLFLAYASFKDFVVYQMDVKSAFLYGKIEEEVYVCQPPRFEDPEFPDRVYKVEKALYGLNQAPRAWYETLSTYLLENEFQRGTIDKTLFIKKVKSDILLVQVYVDDIIFGSTMKDLCTEFKKLMHKNQDKYVDKILKKFGFSNVKTTSTPMETSKPLIKDKNAKDVDVHLYRSMIGSLMYLTSLRPDIMFADSPFDLEAYTDSDYAGASLDRKSTTGEYVATASCCGKVLWIQNQMLDYGYKFMNTKIFIDNESTICIVKNPVFHSKTKHIEIRHHFIRDSNEKKLIQMIKIHTDQNVADLLTKAFDVGRFQYLIATNDEIQVSAVGLTYYCAKTTSWNEFSSTMASAVICLATNQKFNFSKYIFDNMVKNLEGGVKFLMYPRFVQVFLDKQVEGMTKHKEIYVTPSHTKKVFANMKRGGKGFSRRVTHLFQTMMVQAPEELGEGSEIPTDPQHTPTIIQPSTSQHQNKQPRRKQRKDTEVPQPSGSTEPITDDDANVEHVPTHSNDPLFSEITKLKERVKKLERRNKSRTLGLKGLRKVGRFAQVVSSEDEGLGAQEDASKQGRKIANLNADAEVTLVDEAQGRNDDNLMFDTGVLDEQEVEVEKVVSIAEVTTVSATTITIDEI
ncbi:putative ribonuclease H-like domain-containing protein [Tanacetum coccineum]